MAYIPYPEAPQNPNSWQILGNTITQGSQIVGGAMQEQNRLKMLMEDAAQKRAAAQLAQIKADRDAQAAQAEEARRAAEDARKASESDAKAAQQKRSQSTRDEISRGKTVPGRSVNGVVGPDEVTEYPADEARRMLLSSGDLSGERFTEFQNPAKTTNSAASQVVTLADGTLARVSRAADGSLDAQPYTVNGQPAKTYKDPKGGQIVTGTDSEGNPITLTLPHGASQAIPVTMPGGKAVGSQRVDRPGTEDQTKAATFSRRMELAMADLAELEAKGYDRTTTRASVQASGPSGLNSSKGQRWSNAEQNFATANLRKESGAVIGDEEMIRQEALYFPRWNDSKETKAQKARNRAQAYEGMKSAAGPQFGKVKAVGDRPTYQEYNTMPSGTEYTDPKGNVRRKK